MRWSPVLLFLIVPWPAEAATIYHCKAYSGGTFWSAAHCREHNALIDRIVTVPDGMPFDQQVNLGEQARANGAAIATPPPQPAVVQQVHPQVDRSAECSGLAARIAHLAAMARQPQSGYTQDWITAERRTARDRQFRLKC
jgi:hypothetical protein